MGNIFISHSSADRKIAEAVAEALRIRRIESQFLDNSPENGIPAAADWEQELYRRLWGCSALLALVTDHYLASRWCFAELCLARMRGKRVVALLADPLKIDAVLPAQLSLFQRVDAREDFSHALDALAEGFELAGLAEDARFALSRGRCPYPGLNAFEAEDAGVFFGRNEEIRQLEEHLRRVVPPGAPRSLLVVGGSGVGKSSLVRAGLLPRRGGGWNVLGPFRPGAHPIQQIAFSIEELTGTSALEIDGRLRASDASLSLLLRAALPRECRALPVLIVIDQLEELLPALPNSAAARLAELVCEAVSEPHGNIQVLGTLRTTDLDALLAHPILRRLAYHQPFTVAPIAGDALRLIITGPADKAGLRFDEGLVGRILNDMSRSQALPLLAFMLRRLWEYGHRDNLLSGEEYTAIGGLAGAIAVAAEGCVPAAEAKVEALRTGLLRLVRIGMEGEPSSRAVPWSDLTSEEHEALEPLLARYLLARDVAGETGVDTVRVAHEALFRAWDRLSRWIGESREQLVIAHHLEGAEALWRSADRQVTDLWRGARLSRARELVESRRLVPSEGEREFLAAATACEEAERARELEQQAALAHSARAALSRGLALQAQVDTNPARALLLAHASAQIQAQAGEPMGHASEQALRDLLGGISGRIRFQRPGCVRRLWTHMRLAAVLAQYNDGSLVWVPPRDLHSPCVLLPDPPPDIEQVGFGADGSLTVLTTKGLVQRWDAMAPGVPAPRTLTPPDHAFRCPRPRA